MLDKLEQYRHYRKYLEPAYGEGQISLRPLHKPVEP